MVIVSFRFDFSSDSIVSDEYYVDLSAFVMAG